MRLSIFPAVLALSVLAVPLTVPAFGADKSCQRDAPDVGHAGSGCGQAWFDANLRIDQIQLAGTAESAKLRPSKAILGLVRMGDKKDAEALDFGQLPLGAQLDAGARTLSFDVAYDPKGGLFKNPAGASMAMDLLDPAYTEAMAQPGFKIIHVLDIDYNSTCLTLDACLAQVAAWSRANPSHVPIIVWVHANDERTPMPGATHPVPFDAAAFDALDGAIRAAFQPGELITPDQLRGGYASLRQAALAHAWPKLGDARGKMVFVLDDNARKVALYAQGHDGLAGRALFVAADETSPLAAFVAIDDPKKEGQRIAAAVTAGFIVRTRADADTAEARAADGSRRDAAFASGAQIVATDFLVPDSRIGPYRAGLSDDRHAVCNGKLLGNSCTGWDVERGAPPVITATR